MRGLSMSEKENTDRKTFSLPVLGEVSRRTALKGLGATLGAGAFAAAISPLASLKEQTSAAELMQRHYKELSDDDKREVFVVADRTAFVALLLAFFQLGLAVFSHAYAPSSPTFHAWWYYAVPPVVGVLFAALQAHVMTRHNNSQQPWRSFVRLPEKVPSPSRR